MDGMAWSGVEYSGSEWRRFLVSKSQIFYVKSEKSFYRMSVSLHFDISIAYIYTETL